METALLHAWCSYDLIPSTLNNLGDTDATRPDWARAREILARVLEAAPADQSRLLDTECGKDDGLRQEVESLLIAAAGSAFFDEPASLRSAAASRWEGRVLSHYEIGAKIGEGGMGAVYRAVDRNLGRTVALKVISGLAISTEEKRRFAREAKAASALNHANIVTIYEYNSTDGVDFLAMEYVDGSTLSQMLAQGSVPLATLLQYASQVASALAKAHAAGIVHRDLKPGNIMVTADGVAKVLDFGLAKVSAAEGEVHTALTKPNTILGTPGYMSPEQALGETTDHRSDIFSFGAILYEVVSGQRAFKGPDMASTLRQVIHREPVPVEELNAGAPEPVVQLIARCLKKDREQRLQSLAEAVGVLESVRGASVTAPVATVVSARAVGGRPRRVLGLAAVVAGLGVVGAVSVPQVRERLLPARVTVVSTPKTSEEWYAQGRAYLARYDRKGNSQRAIDAFQKAIELDGQNAAAYAGLAETYLHSVGTASFDPLTPKLAMESAARALDLNPYLAVAHACYGFALVNSNSASRSEGIARIERAIATDPRDPLAHLYRGLAAESQQDAQAAETHYRKAVQLAPSNWIYHERLGVFFYRAGRLPEAVASFETAARLTPDNAEANSNLGAVYHATGRLEEAAAAYQRSLAANPSARAFWNLGTLFYFLGRYSDSAQAFERALGLDGSSYVRWGNLGDAYRWVPGARQKSLDAYATAIRLAREALGKNPSSLDVQSSLASYLARSGERSSAIAELRKIALSSPPKASVAYKMALTYEICGERALALKFLASAVRGGYSLQDVQSEPEFARLRRDAGFHRTVVPQN